MGIYNIQSTTNNFSLVRLVSALMTRVCLVFVVSFVLFSGTYSHAADMHDGWNALLKKYVSGGNVDYSAIKKNALGDLDAYIAKMSKTDPSSLSKDEQLAYYLNVYNANVVKGIIDAMSTGKKISKTRPFFSDKKRDDFFDKSRLVIAGNPLGKKEISLNELEKGLILRKFEDARVHFALVCAARGCPLLPDHAFSGKKLDHCLDHLATNFLNSKRGVQVEGNSVRLSSILDWYKKDFGTTKEAVLAFVGKYRKGLPKSPRISYLPYSWVLNGH